MKKTTTLLIALLASFQIATAQNCSELFISEYVEGWGNNKAVELYNPTANAIDLSNYQIAKYTNGSTSPSIVGLMGVIAPYDVKVLVLDKRDPNGAGLEEPIYPDLEAVADTFLTPFYDFPTSAMYFNGNDAVALLSSTNQVLDVMGRIGEDPGNGWLDQNGALWTRDQTLVRKSTVLQGDANGYDIFWPEVQWDSLEVNTFTGLGFHACDCNVPTPCTTPLNVSYSGLNTSYTLADGPSTLIGSPFGGVFFGSGITGNQYNPSAAGLGTHSIVYTYIDGSGCVGSYALCTTVDLSVGSPDGDLQSIGVDVYPNPSAGEFNITVPASVINSSYSVYTVNGALVAGGVLGADVTQVDLRGAGSGAYSVVINSAEGIRARMVTVK